MDEGAEADPPVRVDVGVHGGEKGEVVAEDVRRGGAVDGVGLAEGVAVEEDDAVAEVEAVSGEGDDALDEMDGGVVNGIVEDDDVSAVEAGGREEGEVGVGLARWTAC